MFEEGKDSMAKGLVMSLSLTGENMFHTLFINVIPLNYMSLNPGSGFSVFVNIGTATRPLPRWELALPQYSP